MGLRYARQLSDSDRRELAEFWSVAEANRARIDERVRAVARSIPAFASLLSEQSDAELRDTTRELERAALCDGEWEPYIEHLRELGVRYAQLGIELRDWFSLLAAYRRVVLESVLPTYDEHAVRVLEGMDHFLDIAMATIGSAYVDAKEAAARRAETRLGLYIDMFRNAPIGMAVYQCDDPADPGSFRLLAVNPAAAQMAGTQLLDAVGKTIRESHPSLLGTEVLDHMVQTMRDGTAQRWCTVVGSARWYDSQSVHLGDQHIGVLFENVTERRLTEQELERHTRELERSNQELDEFARVASHDLKAPLRDIQNLASWIEEDAGATLPAESKDHLGQLRDRAKRMEQLLSDLLAYSRAGRGGGSPVEFPVRSVIDSAVALAGVPPSFELRVQSEPITLHDDRTPLEQVLRNLINNAAKHHGRCDGCVVVSVRDREQELEFSVQDDGPGIPLEFHQRVFGMFQTLRPRDEVEGSGVGLAIVKKVVEGRGGRIALDSAPSCGTTVRFTWPKRCSRGSV